MEKNLRLNKRKFLWLNDSDLFRIFEEKRNQFYESLTEDEKLNFDGDSYNESEVEKLFSDYDHIAIKADNTIWGVREGKETFLWKRDEVFELAEKIK